MAPARPLLLAGLAAGHAAGLAALLMAAAPLPEAVRAAAISVRAVPAPPVPAAAAPVVTLAAVAVDIAAPAVEIVPDASPGGTGCGLTETIAVALAGDAGVRDALAGTPAAARAVMVWDGAWSGTGAASFVPIRRVIVAQLRAADSTCRAEALTGPRLMIVPTSAANVVVAIGSGTWRWAELMPADTASAG